MNKCFDRVPAKSKIPAGAETAAGWRAIPMPLARIAGMDQNPYKAPNTSRSAVTKRRQSLPPTALTGWTAVTVTLFLLYGGVYLHWRLTTPPPIGMDFGMGILSLLGLLNVPFVVWWLVWWLERIRPSN